MTTSLHLVGSAADPDDQLPPGDGRPPHLVLLVGCRSCGLPRRDHGVDLIHRFVRAGRPPAHGGTPQPEPPRAA